MDQLSTGIKLKGSINCHLPHQRERKYCDKYCESLRSPTSLHYSQGTDRHNGRHLCERKRAHVEHCDTENSRKKLSASSVCVDQQSLNNLQTSDKKKKELNHRQASKWKSAKTCSSLEWDWLQKSQNPITFDVKMPSFTTKINVFATWYSFFLSL